MSYGETKRQVRKTECDVPMARSKRLLPCDKDCMHCIACIVMNGDGERGHIAIGSRANVIQPCEEKAYRKTW